MDKERAQILFQTINRFDSTGGDGMMGMGSGKNTIINNKLKFIAGFLGGLFSSGLSAAPSNEISFLMDQSISVFDWGIFRTEQRVAGMADRPELFSRELGDSAVNYDWRNNRIIILAAFNGLGSRDECEDGIQELASALTGAEDSKDRADAAVKTLDKLFHHPGGYKSEKRPRNLGAQLARITELHVEVYAGEDEEPKVRCQSPILGNRITFN